MQFIVWIWYEFHTKHTIYCVVNNHWLYIDPIDYSLNLRKRKTFFSLSYINKENLILKQDSQTRSLSIKCVLADEFSSSLFLLLMLFCCLSLILSFWKNSLKKLLIANFKFCRWKMYILKFCVFNFWYKLLVTICYQSAIHTHTHNLRSSFECVR